MHCKLQKFTSGGIESGGYSVAKFGNVVLTRMFPHFKPRPSDDGVKTYALCPFAVPTRLVLDGFGKDKSPEDAKREAAKTVFNATKSRETFRLVCKLWGRKSVQWEESVRDVSYSTYCGHKSVAP